MQHLSDATAGMPAFLAHDTDARARNLHVSMIDRTHMRHIYDFALRVPEMRACADRLQTLVLKGGLSVDWCTDDQRFVNVRPSKGKRAAKSVPLPDERELSDQLAHVLRWLVLFGFVPFYAPVPALPQAADHDSTGTAGSAADDDWMDELGEKEDYQPPRPPPSVMSSAGRVVPGGGSAPWTGPRLLPEYVRNALPSRAGASLISKLCGTSNPDCADDGGADRLVVPIVQDIQAGAILRVEDELSGRRHLVYVPGKMVDKLTSLDAFLEYVRASPFHVFVGLGMMPDRSGRIMSPVAGLLREYERVMAFEQNLLQADAAASAPPIFTQDDPRLKAGDEEVEFERFADALPRILDDDGQIAARPGETRQMYARMSSDARRIEARAEQLRARALGLVNTSEKRSPAEIQRDMAMRFGADGNLFAATASRVFELPAGQTMLNAPSTLPRVLQNPLEWRQLFQLQVCMAYRLPRGFMYPEARGGQRATADADLIIREVRDTVEETRQALVSFFEFAYRAAHEHVDNEYIEGVILGLDQARDAGLQVIDRQIGDTAQASAPTEVLIRDERRRDAEALRQEIVESFEKRRGRWEDAKHTPAGLRARLVFNQPSMGMLQDVKDLVEIGAISFAEQAALARRIANVAGYEQCADNDNDMIPSDVLQRVRLREENMVPQKRERAVQSSSSAKKT